MLAYIKPCVILILLSAFIVFGSEPISSGIDSTNQTAYKVLRVVDGDTIYLSIGAVTTDVRLIGVNAPEADALYGTEATRFLDNLLKGEEVYIKQESGMDKDRHNRALFYVYRAPDGLFVNQEIVRQGYGKVYTDFPFQYMESFKGYEQKAKEVKKGLWMLSDEEKNLAPDDKYSSKINFHFYFPSPLMGEG